MLCTCGSWVSFMACNSSPLTVEFTESWFSSSPSDGECFCRALLMLLKLSLTRPVTCATSVVPNRGTPRPTRLFATILCTEASKKSLRSGQSPGLWHAACSGLRSIVDAYRNASIPNMPNFSGQMSAREKSSDSPTSNSGSHGSESGPEKASTAPCRSTSQAAPSERMHMSIRSRRVLPSASAPASTAMILPPTFVAASAVGLAAKPFAVFVACIQPMASTSSVISHWPSLPPNIQREWVCQLTSFSWNCRRSSSWCQRCSTMLRLRSSSSSKFNGLARTAAATYRPKFWTRVSAASAMASVMYCLTVALILRRRSSFATWGAFSSMALVMFLKLLATRPLTIGRSASLRAGEAACTRVSATAA
mmetsp:Transcript_24089/g.75516  ORF Transcript_24089/g.75516 Transcript_24089/m.75516 type:complete len:364 (+) Transcript_24089:2268-3359(+)